MALHLFSPFLLSVEEAKTFLLDNNIVPMSKRCSACGNIATITTMDDNIYHRCRARGCQSRKKIYSTNLSILMLLRIIFSIIIGMDYRMLRLAFGIADSTISRIRNVLRSCFESYLIDHPVMLGGPGVIVELDETVLCRRRVIRSPTNEDDEIADTVWIIGGIDRTDARNFFIQVIPNRQIGHMLAAVRHRIAPGSILVTDGHPSYPAVASELEMEHRSVNHSVGFTTLDGVHSNNIEAFWSHLKATMRKEFGIRRENLVMWLLEYTFRRRFIQDASPQEFEAIFISILIEFFE